MQPISFKRHRFPPDVIRQAVWLYLRFTLSLRDVEEMLAQRGIDVSYETIRAWVIKFGPQIAAKLKARRPAPSPRWHLDERVCRVRRKRMFLWRAVDDEGEVLDTLMYPLRDGWTARCCQSNGNSSPGGRNEPKPNPVYPMTDCQAASAAARLSL